MCAGNKTLKEEFVYQKERCEERRKRVK